MPNLTKTQNDTVVNVTFQLVGEDAALLTAYKSKEYLTTLSSAARKAALEHLNTLRTKGKLAVQPASEEATI